jgi:hypothetical protein
MDKEYAKYAEVYYRFLSLGFAYQGGWAEQPWQHVEVIELFQALDAAIPRQ